MIEMLRKFFQRFAGHELVPGQVVSGSKSALGPNRS